jgi:hypothetical protein
MKTILLNLRIFQSYSFSLFIAKDLEFGEISWLYDILRYVSYVIILQKYIILNEVY